ncbi:MAG TPA: DUF2235 domain-containing protein [Conexibacter sp.]|nr:DUF2235 domain-containing protein [Conexibacter sp.]
MSKRIVIACDGTWNRPDQVHGDEVTPSNVTKLALAVADDDGGTEQRVFYERGVGTGGTLDRLSGGAIGIGLSDNVLAPYRFLTQHYVPGDDLYLFGFSRGAFTARSLAGLIGNCGILRPEHLGAMDDAFSLYRDRAKSTRPNSNEARLFRRTYAYREPPRENGREHPYAEDRTPIRFLGVWDTVGALGIPIPAPVPKKLRAYLSRRWSFHDVQLGSHVWHAAHAMAIDERRRPFEPTPFKRQADAPPAQTIEQVWFAGVHSDVGGGYPDPRLADITLLWMVDRAAAHGLAFKPEWFQRTASPDKGRRESGEDVRPDALGVQHDSMTLFYRALKPFDRRLGDAPGSHVASSARLRLETASANYHPTTLRDYLEEHPDRVTDVVESP